jgi:thiamine-monophosphate kinase
VTKRVRPAPPKRAVRPERVEQLGEFGLIRRIERLIERQGGGARSTVQLGFGDDAALLRPRAGEDVAVSCDASVEGVHFDFAHETPATAGRRALAAAVSDLAAMGARPLGCTASLATPGRAGLREVLGLCRGLVQQAALCETPLVGGNVTRADRLALHLSVFGAVGAGRALRREGAREGDRILVTGQFGAAALARARGRVRGASPPRLAAGRALVRGRLASACIDVSDGLVADLRHLCRASGVGAELDAGKVPRPAGLARAARALGRDPEALVLSGGEDYELLFTAAARGPSEAVLSRRLGVRVTCIGRITRRGIRVRASAGNLAGFRHF